MSAKPQRGSCCFWFMYRTSTREEDRALHWACDFFPKRLFFCCATGVPLERQDFLSNHFCALHLRRWYCCLSLDIAFKWTVKAKRWENLGLIPWFYFIHIHGKPSLTEWCFFHRRSCFAKYRLKNVTLAQISSSIFAQGYVCEILYIINLYDCINL